MKSKADRVVWHLVRFTGRLARIWGRFPEVRSDSFPAAHQEYLDYRGENESLEEVGAYSYGTAVLVG